VDNWNIRVIGAVRVHGKVIDLHGANDLESRLLEAERQTACASKKINCSQSAAPQPAPCTLARH
jgi:hypothetical protein